jgi:anthranilate synthase/aminodeoxychorismate synthase-like glutamine amidotransferase
MVRSFHEQLPILGVCLGHQVIAEALGGQVIRAATPRHGQTSPVLHSGSGLFAGLPSPLQACRYHSLVVDPATLPATFRVTATTDDHVLMAIEHVELPVFGLQFHPEAILTEGGYRLLANFLKLAGCHTVANPDRLTADEHLRTERDTSPLPTAPVTF